MFVDGKKVAEFPKLKREDGLQKVEIELPASLTFFNAGCNRWREWFQHGSNWLRRSDSEARHADGTDVTTTASDLKNFASSGWRLTAKLESLGPPPKFYGVVAESDVPEVRLLTRGDPESPTGDALTPAALGSLAMLNPDLETLESSEGQRRAALARWITHPDNPLTRRVIVNRLWHWHFGKGLVDTPSDFGFGGGRPSHPELLDWLAEELVRHNWSLKEMHRLILKSETYQQTSYVE